MGDHGPVIVVSADQSHVVVIGGANLDILARSTAPAAPATSNPGRATTSGGGVGRNIAENLGRLGVRTHLLTAVGRDASGELLLEQTAEAGVHLDLVHHGDLPTGTYTAVLDHDGELIVAVADMAAVDALGPEQVNLARERISTSGLLVLDGNLSATALVCAHELAHAAGVRTVLEPVSGPKAALLASTVTAERPLYAVTPDRAELGALTDLPVGDDRQLTRAAASLHERGVEHVWVRLGRRGSLFSTREGTAMVLDALPATVVDVTGAGDSMLAAFCYALLDGVDPVDAARFGHAAAALTVASTYTVRPDLSPQLVRDTLDRHAADPRGEPS